jgi:hypothetical protein
MASDLEWFCWVINFTELGWFFWALNCDGLPVFIAGDVGALFASHPPRAVPHLPSTPACVSTLDFASNFLSHPSVHSITSICIENRF